jgi:hypothetical protein
VLTALPCLLWHTSNLSLPLLLCLSFIKSYWMLSPPRRASHSGRVLGAMEDQDGILSAVR